MAQPLLSEILEEILVDDQIPELLRLYEVAPLSGENVSPARALAHAMLNGRINLSRYPSKDEALKT